MGKILSAQIREGIYYLLKRRRMYPKEQKECHKGIRGTEELLYIDQQILSENEMKKKKIWCGLII